MNLYCILSSTRNKSIKLKSGTKQIFFIKKNFFSNEKKYFKIGIVGAGPAALYCCKYFLKNDNIKVDIFDKLPNPFGLIRYGVAPDHMQVKNTYKTFDPVFLNKNYRFFGNVNIGVDLKIEDLRSYYNACIFCCGASDISLPNLESEKRNGIFHARDLIYFYNNYYEELRCKNIDNYLNSYDNFSNSVIIGNGNVSLDIARILTKSHDELKKTDINSNFLNAAKRHNFKHIYIIGRRGFWQSSFTTAELRELLNLSNIKVILNKNNYDLCFHLKNYDENSSIKQRQNKLFLNMVKNYEDLEKNKNLYEKYKIIEFIFYYEIKKINYINNYMKNLEFEINKNLQISDPSLQKKYLTTPLLIFATGFKKNAFNENLYNKSTEKFKEDILTNKFGIFKAGWFDKGAKGNIASQIPNSKAIISLIFNFLQNTTTFFDNDICDLLNKKKIHFVNFDDWIYIQNYEKKAGMQTGKIAEKLNKVKQLLHILDERKQKMNPA
ncbi:adrenodoxin reductase, putative [Plasmodium relictum]|uniref:NADPH:adrenodoxin oxidoreductase, mitochondrial n=1 Tax=Plasmodium relictum TaxID=85471 RepID=A0A1J1H685_PLARL|nr:adrenodoxin reductase, putative [Plasmodium relictum]CRH00268.1 adrenodoxin reductase, putative [Plasmodium relictum]